jgi:hypothetical protein
MGRGPLLLAVLAAVACVDLQQPGPLVSKASTAPTPGPGTDARPTTDAAASPDTGLPPAPDAVATLDAPPPDAPGDAPSDRAAPIDAAPPDAAPPPPPDAAPDASAAVSAKGLLAYWKLDEGQGRTAADSSGAGHNGVISGTVFWSAGFDAAKFADPFSLNLNGTDAYVTVARAPDLEPAIITVSLWVKRAASSPMGEWIVAKSWQRKAAPTLASYALSFGAPGPDGVISFITGHAGAVDTLPANKPLPDQTWVHVVAIYDPTGAPPQKRLYMDGEMVASRAGTVPLAYDTSSPGGDLLIGQNNAMWQYWKGYVDDVRLYGRALDPTEIATLAAGR